MKTQWAYNIHTFTRFYLPQIYDAQNYWNQYDCDYAQFHQMKCEHCGQPGAERKRQNTAYCDDSQNFATLCPKCWEENDGHWAETWEAYNAGRL